MLLIGAGAVAAALTGDIKIWTTYVMVVAPAAKVTAFAAQDIAIRLLIRGRMRSAVACSCKGVTYLACRNPTTINCNFLKSPRNVGGVLY